MRTDAPSTVPAVLGRDLPAGSTIALSSRVLSAQQLNEASARHENQWLAPTLALVGFCFLILGAVSSLCLLPLLGDAALVGYEHVEDGPSWARIISSIPVWVRAACALVCCISAVVPLFVSRKVRSRPTMLLLLPALAGYSAIGFVSVADVHALTIAPVVGVWVALIVSLAVVSLTVTPSALSALLAWVCATALVTIGALPAFSGSFASRPCPSRSASTSSSWLPVWRCASPIANSSTPPPCRQSRRAFASLPSKNPVPSPADAWQLSSGIPKRATPC